MKKKNYFRFCYLLFVFLLSMGVALLPQSAEAKRKASAQVCTESDWTYSDGVCQPDNTFTRTWSKISDCKRGVKHPPTEILECTYTPICTEDDWTYYDGPCQLDNTFIRTWTKTTNCEGGYSIPVTEEIHSCEVQEAGDIQRYVKVYSPHVNFSTSVYDSATTASVLDNMVQQDIKNLIVSLAPNSLQWSGYTANFVEFLDMAKAYGVNVHLRILQTATFTYEENHAEALSRVQKCIDFILANKNYYLDPIQSIYLNIEPNTLDEWKSADWDTNVSVRRDIMEQWLTLMDSIHTLVKYEHELTELMIYAGIDYYYDSKYRQGIFPEGNPDLLNNILDAAFVMAYFDDTDPTVLTTQEKLDYLIRVSEDEVVATPTSIAIDVLDYADYEEIISVSDALDAYFQGNSNYLGVTYLKYETMQQKFEER